MKRTLKNDKIENSVNGAQKEGKKAGQMVIASINRILFIMRSTLIPHLPVVMKNK
jgi:hypothetical protein